MKDYGFYGWETADIRERHGLTPREIYDLLSDIWCAETCAPRMRSGWSEQNKTLGQCSITAFLAQDLFGGEVKGVPLGDGNYHCFNVAGGCVFDLTSEQFGDVRLDYSDSCEQTREAHFAKEEKRERYELLRARLMAALPKIIETERLILRPFVAADAADIFEYLRSPQVNCFNSMKLGSSEEAVDAARQRAAEKDYYLAIALKTSGKVIGELFGEPESSDPEDGVKDTFSPCWMLNAEYQGQGYAFEAAEAYFDYLFNEKGIRRIYAYTEDTNVQSQKLCEKLGMRREGLFKEFVSFVNGPDGNPLYENTYQYAILKKEWTCRDGRETSTPLNDQGGTGMLNYCEICCLTFEEERCPKCNRKSKRTVEPDDLCFLTEKELIWSGMLADVLRQKGIPFVEKNVLGAGLALRTGLLLERVRFYVLYKMLPEAEEIVEELFSASED